MKMKIYFLLKKPRIDALSSCYSGVLGLIRQYLATKMLKFGTKYKKNLLIKY